MYVRERVRVCMSMCEAFFPPFVSEMGGVKGSIPHMGGGIPSLFLSIMWRELCFDLHICFKKCQIFFVHAFGPREISCVFEDATKYDCS